MSAFLSDKRSPERSGSPQTPKGNSHTWIHFAREQRLRMAPDQNPSDHRHRTMERRREVGGGPRRSRP